MATVFKTFLNDDITSTRTLLHESIPITGTITSGTYGTFPNEDNIKNFATGLYQAVYDYPYLSSSANHIFDLTVGYSSGSTLSGTSNRVQQEKKINIYTQMAQVCMGYDANGKVLQFDEDGNLAAGGTKIKDAIFFNFSRLLQKDEIKKGSFSMKLGTTGTAGSIPFGQASDFGGSVMGSLLTITDSGKENDYRVNSPAGEYAILSASTGGSLSTAANPACGLIFYQAGIVVLTASVFLSADSVNGEVAGYGREGKIGHTVTCSQGPLNAFAGWTGSAGIGMNTTASVFGTPWGKQNIVTMLTGSSISSSCDAIRHRIYDISFNNTTELNSTIHFCRINHNDFNYSSNPTYLSESKIRVKNNTLDAPVSYITTVGLYSADNELLAVAKLSEPLKKDPTNEMTLRVRLDY